MPRNEEREVRRRARRDRTQGKSPSTQAGEFVREEMHHVREGRHGARSTKQAIAIGLNKARRAGVRLPRRGKSASSRRRPHASHGTPTRHTSGRPSARRSRAITRALRREGHGAASHRSLASQAHASARRRGAAARSASARRAVQTKGAAGRRAAARKAARTRAAHRKK